MSPIPANPVAHRRLRANRSRRAYERRETLRNGRARSHHFSLQASPGSFRFAPLGVALCQDSLFLSIPLLPPSFCMSFVTSFFLHVLHYRTCCSFFLRLLLEAAFVIFIHRSTLLLNLTSRAYVIISLISDFTRNVRSDQCLWEDTARKAALFMHQQDIVDNQS